MLLGIEWPGCLISRTCITMSEDIMGKKTGLAFGAGKAGYLPLRKSLAERAYDILEEAIITLGLAPGSIISEQELSELTGIGHAHARGDSAAFQGSFDSGAAQAGSDGFATGSGGPAEPA